MANDGAELILPTLLPVMAREFNLSYSQTGILGGSMIIALGFGQILMGYLSDATGKRKIFVSLGLALLSLGLFGVSRSTSYGELILFNLVAGFGASAYHPVGVSTISELFKNGKKGKALGIHGTGGNIGMTLFPLFSGLLADQFGWRVAFMIFPVIGISLSALFFTLVREPFKTGKTTRLKLMLNPTLLMIAISLGFISMAARGMAVFFPMRLNSIGYSSSQVGALFSLLFGAGIIGQYSGGYFSDVYPKKQLVAYLCIISSIVLLIPFFMENTILIIIIVLVAGFTKDAVWPPLFGLFTDKAPEQFYGTTLGMFFSLGYIMASQAPIIMGFLSDYVTFSVSMFLIVAFGVAAALSIRKV
jgi:MFS family permease